jgi:hypothetical protein
MVEPNLGRTNRATANFNTTRDSISKYSRRIKKKTSFYEEITTGETPKADEPENDHAACYNETHTFERI